MIEFMKEFNSNFDKYSSVSLISTEDLKIFAEFMGNICGIVIVFAFSILLILVFISVILCAVDELKECKKVRTSERKRGKNE